VTALKLEVYLNTPTFHCDGIYSLPTMSATSHPVSQFFTSFADIGFTHQSTAPLVPEFARLRKMAKWSKAEAWEIRGQFYDAVADEFGFLFGTDLGNLEQLQRLCELVHIHPAPDTVKESKKVSSSQNHEVGFLSC
jgi:hypothetical protein